MFSWLLQIVLVFWFLEAKGQNPGYFLTLFPSYIEEGGDVAGQQLCLALDSCLGSWLCYQAPAAGSASPISGCYCCFPQESKQALRFRGFVHLRFLFKSYPGLQNYSQHIFNWNLDKNDFSNEIYNVSCFSLSQKYQAFRDGGGESLRRNLETKTEFCFVGG